MKRFLLPVLLFAAVVFQTSCAKLNEEELSGARYCEIDTPSYQQDIAPLISKRCTNCHKPSNAQGGFDFTTYSDLSDIAQVGVLLGVIRHENGFIPMPASGPKLPDCEIQVIRLWVEQGALNN